MNGHSTCECHRPRRTLRSISETVSQFVFALCSLLLLSGDCRGEERPNILIVFADDWGRYASIYGQQQPGGLNDIVKTPNFDRVAREGVLFNNAFVNAPSCTPCRSSLLSGQYFWRTGKGAILQGAEWDAAIPSFPLMLQSAGYHIGYTFKVWGPGTPADAPYGGKANEYAKQGRNFNKFSQFVSEQPEVEPGKQKLYDEVRGNFQDFLKARPQATPFCYWFGPTNTHRKWTAGSGKKLWNIDPDSLKGKIPKDLPDVPEVREDLADYLGEVQAVDAGLGVLLDELEKTGELDNTLIIVSGDHGIPGVPRGKCNLYDLGVEVSLAIRWPQKIPAGRILDDFVCLPDLCTTILEAAGEKPTPAMTGRSLMPVLASTKSGLVDPTRDAVIVGRERHVADARDGFLPYPQRAIRTKDFLYIRNFAADRWPMGSGPGYGKPSGPFGSKDDLTEDTFAAFSDMDSSPTKAWLIEHRDDPTVAPYFLMAFDRRPEEELYDLRTDAAELHNVAADASYAEAKEALSQRLMTVLKETNDPRATSTTYDEPPFSSPVEKPGKPAGGKKKMPGN
ncbi:sulfatase-like hydrolase/transferase [Planctomicrobium piriforme]|nr:sulfatase-like hydrolase/transferase [Planctomicrobium piriforme]